MAELTVEALAAAGAGRGGGASGSDQKEADFAVGRGAGRQSPGQYRHGPGDRFARNQANLGRLAEMKVFARITAPFDGVVTARTWISARWFNFRQRWSRPRAVPHGPDPGDAHLRQCSADYVGSIHPGQTAELRVQELPGQVFSAKVTRIANALDPGSRAMITVLEVAHSTRHPDARMYAQVRFSTGRAEAAVIIPGDALTTGRQGPRVAGGRHGSSHPIFARSASAMTWAQSSRWFPALVAPGEVVVAIRPIPVR